jgi:hypothetical protein
VLLGVCILENARNIFFKEYDLDFFNYVTLSSFSFQAALKYTGVEIDPCTNSEIMDLIYRGMRGGVTTLVTRLAYAENELLGNSRGPEHDTHLLFHDATNLYGTAGLEKLPVGDFTFLDPSLYDVLNLDLSGDFNYVVEVTVKYPEHLHEVHDQFPFLPEKGAPLGEKGEKLLLTLRDKENYVCALENLQQACSRGLELVRVHQLMRYRQEAWLAPYFNKNNEIRSASNDLLIKNLYKLLNNGCFGRLMLNKLKFRDIEFVDNEKDLKKRTKKFNFK